MIHSWDRIPAWMRFGKFPTMMSCQSPGVGSFATIPLSDPSAALPCPASETIRRTFYVVGVIGLGMISNISHVIGQISDEPDYEGFLDECFLRCNYVWWRNGHSRLDLRMRLKFYHPQQSILSAATCGLFELSGRRMSGLVHNKVISQFRSPFDL